MANELKHVSVGTELTQAEWEALTSHILSDQAIGDLIYASTITQLRRLGIGSTNDFMQIVGGIPAWVTAPIFGGAPDFNSQVATNGFELIRSLYRGLSPVFMSWPAAAEVLLGTGSTSVAEDVVTCALGATTLSKAGRSPRWRRAKGSSDGFSFNKKAFIGFTMRAQQAEISSNVAYRVQIAGATDLADLADHGMGIKCVGNGSNADISLVSYGTSASQASVAASVTIGHATNVAILIEFDPTSAIRLYVDGTLRATQSTAANIPSVSPGDVYLVAGVRRTGGADTGNEQFIIYNLHAGEKA